MKSKFENCAYRWILRSHAPKWTDCHHLSLSTSCTRWWLGGRSQSPWTCTRKWRHLILILIDHLKEPQESWFIPCYSPISQINTFHERKSIVAYKRMHKNVHEYMTHPTTMIIHVQDQAWGHGTCIKKLGAIQTIWNLESVREHHGLWNRISNWISKAKRQQG